MVDYREWLEKAYVFLEEAKDDVSRGRYWLACFHAQQFAEIALKAVLEGWLAAIFSPTALWSCLKR
jgi:HEPN domain-containing protein